MMTAANSPSAAVTRPTMADGSVMADKTLGSAERFQRLAGKTPLRAAFISGGGAGVEGVEKISVSTRLKGRDWATLCVQFIMALATPL